MTTADELEWWSHARKVMRMASAPCLAGSCYVLRDYDVHPIPDARAGWRPPFNDNREGFDGAPAA